MMNFNLGKKERIYLVQRRRNLLLFQISFSSCHKHTFIMLFYFGISNIVQSVEKQQEAVSKINETQEIRLKKKKIKLILVCINTVQPISPCLSNYKSIIFINLTFFSFGAFESLLTFDASLD